MVKALDMVSGWVEYVCIIILLIGFILAALAGSAFMSYLTILLCGMLTGRLIYHNRKGFTFKDYVFAIVFLAGYILGSKLSFGRQDILIILFVFGNLLSYRLHEKKFLK